MSATTLIVVLVAAIVSAVSSAPLDLNATIDAATSQVASVVNHDNSVSSYYDMLGPIVKELMRENTTKFSHVGSIANPNFERNFGNYYSMLNPIVKELMKEKKKGEPKTTQENNNLAASKSLWRIYCVISHNICYIFTVYTAIVLLCLVLLIQVIKIIAKYYTCKRYKSDAQENHQTTEDQS